MTQPHDFPGDDLRCALKPFLLAASVGYCVEQDVAEAKPRQHTNIPLVAFAGYAGQYAAQSHVSWADWKRLLDVAYAAGLLGPLAPASTPQPDPEPPLPDSQLANGGACS